MEETIKGIVIRSTDYGEKDKIVDVFSPTGMVTFSAKGVRGASAKLKSLTALLTYGEFTLRQGRGKKVLSGGEVVENFFPCWTDPKRYSCAMICLETVEKLFKREEETKDEFVMLLKALGEITYGENALAACDWFVVRCAERTGCEYQSIAEFDPDTYQLISAIADGTEKGVVGATEGDLFSALRSIALCLNGEFGVRLRSLREAERIFFGF